MINAISKPNIENEVIYFIGVLQQITVDSVNVELYKKYVCKKKKKREKRNKLRLLFYS